MGCQGYLVAHWRGRGRGQNAEMVALEVILIFVYSCIEFLKHVK